MKAFAVLVTNCAGRKGLLAEHGLSLFIRHKSGDILMDTGAGPLFLDNASFMNLQVEKIDFALLSHEHYDHAGGIPALSRMFSMISMSCPLYHPDDFDRPQIPAIAFKSVNESTSLKENIHLVATAGTCKDGEDIKDIRELSLVIDDTLFIGCCHSGFETVLKEAHKFSNIKMIVGGFHNYMQNDHELEKSAEFLKRSGVEKVIILHCSSNRFFIHLEKVGIEAKVANVGHSFNF